MNKIADRFKAAHKKIEREFKVNVNGELWQWLQGIESEMRKKHGHDEQELESILKIPSEWIGRLGQLDMYMQQLLNESANIKED